MHNFSMRLDLSNFFSDERSMSLVLIDAAWQNIKDVQDHIQSLFSLKDLSLLTTDGCFLPPRESIQVLRSAGGLKAFRFSDPEKDVFAEPTPLAKPSKKRKNRSHEGNHDFTSSTPNQPKRSKNRNTTKSPDIPEETSVKRKKHKSKITKSPETPLETEPKCADKRSSKISKSREIQEKTADEGNLTESEGFVVDSSPDISTRSFEFPLKKPFNSTNYKNNEKANGKPSDSEVSFQSNNRSNLSKTSKKKLKKANRTAVDKEQMQKEELPKEKEQMAFCCPLMELDPNTARIIELPFRKSKVKILENIAIKVPIIINQAQTQANENQAESLAVYREKNDQVFEANMSTTMIEANILQHDELHEEPGDLNQAFHPVDVEKESSLVKEQESVVEKETSVLEEEASVVEEEASVVEEAASVLEEDASVVKEEASVVKEAASGLEEEESVVKEEASVVEDKVDTEMSQMEKNGKAEESASKKKSLRNTKPRYFEETLVSDSDDDVMLLDDTNVDDSDSDVQTIVPTAGFRESEVILDLMRTATKLNNLPGCGDTIIFKLLKIRGKESSGLTDFIAGSCSYINRRTKSIAMDIISSPFGVNRTLRQYSGNLDDTGDAIHCLNVNFKDLREAKIVVATVD
ncbi:hypothetical protein KR009_003429 [Drosophila setifemur]|nr:hypothetical protein KR009_003429 [Drosophila setifemur]